MSEPPRPTASAHSSPSGDGRPGDVNRRWPRRWHTVGSGGLGSRETNLPRPAFVHTNNRRWCRPVVVATSIRIAVRVHVGDGDVEDGTGESEVLRRLPVGEPDDELPSGAAGFDPIPHAVAVDVGRQGLCVGCGGASAHKGIANSRPLRHRRSECITRLRLYREELQIA